MKKVLHLLALAIVLTSCSNESDQVEVSKQESLLKSYKVSRDSNGKYTIDYKVVDNATAEVIKNQVSDFNEIYLYSDKYSSKKEHSESFSLEENQLKVGFLEKNDLRKSLIIKDKNILLAKGAKNNEFLRSYSIEEVDENVYELNFEVKNNVVVDFVYNEAESIYEVNLKEGTSNETNFSKTYVKESDMLKIDFVNFTLNQNTSSKSAVALLDEEGYDISKRPKVIIR